MFILCVHLYMYPKIFTIDVTLNVYFQFYDCQLNKPLIIIIIIIITHTHTHTHSNGNVKLKPPPTLLARCEQKCVDTCRVYLSRNVSSQIMFTQPVILPSTKAFIMYATREISNNIYSK